MATGIEGATYTITHICSGNSPTMETTVEADESPSDETLHWGPGIANWKYCPVCGDGLPLTLKEVSWTSS